MTTYEFTLKLNRAVTDDEIEALYEAGCDDAGIETGPLGTLADFSREVSSLAEAIASAVHDIEKVPGLRVTGVQCDNMVTIAGIASRAGVSREAARLWTTGQRGPGGFPNPALITTGGEQVWDWPQVARWLAEQKEQAQGGITASAIAALHVLITADRVLAARDALRTEPDDLARAEFERLLEDA
jgi:hypothetical protein